MEGYQEVFKLIRNSLLTAIIGIIVPAWLLNRHELLRKKPIMSDEEMMISFVQTGLFPFQDKTNNVEISISLTDLAIQKGYKLVDMIMIDPRHPKMACSGYDPNSQECSSHLNPGTYNFIAKIKPNVDLKENKHYNFRLTPSNLSINVRYFQWHDIIYEYPWFFLGVFFVTMLLFQPISQHVNKMLNRRNPIGFRR